MLFCWALRPAMKTGDRTRRAGGRGGRGKAGREVGGRRVLMSSVGKSATELNVRWGVRFLSVLVMYSGRFCFGEEIVSAFAP